jgi:hypothetical protein
VTKADELTRKILELKAQRAKWMDRLVEMRPVVNELQTILADLVKSERGLITASVELKTELFEQAMSVVAPEPKEWVDVHSYAEDLASVVGSLSQKGYWR